MGGEELILRVPPSTNNDSSIVIVETIRTGSKMLGLNIISETELTESQKKLANVIYDSTKSTLQSVINDANVNNIIKITKTLGQLIRELENVKIDGKSPSSSDKKAVAICLGRLIVKDIMPDDKGEKEVLILYDLIAESTLESMIEVSKTVNIKKTAISIFSRLLKFLKLCR
jgi:hypothetical protein